MAKAANTETVPDEAAEAGSDVAVRDGGGTEIEALQAMRAEMEALREETREDIDLENDIRLPALDLIQATTKIPDDLEDAMPGRFWHTGNNGVYKAPILVIAKVLKTRTRFGPQLGEIPLCSSPDAKNGYGEPGDDLEIRGPNGGGSCQVCPEAAIRKPNGERGSCALNYNYIGILVEADGEPVRFHNSLPVAIRMKRTSAKTAKRLNALLLDDDFYWSQAFALGATREENEKGVYQVWTIKVARPATAQEQIRAFEIAKQLNEAQRRQQMIEVVEPPSGGGRSSGGSDGGEPGEDDDIPF